MKKLLMLAVAIITFSLANGQILKRIGDRAKNKIERKAGDKVEKGIDDAVDGKKKETKNETQESSGSASESATNEETSAADKEEAASAEPAAMKAYSKYDFVPGDKVFAYEDFSTTENGDFPTRWNTNGTAEVVTLSSKEGKWMKISKEAVFYPEFITDLPENFTIEFDLGVNNGWNSYPFHINIAKLKAPENFDEYGHYVRWQGDHALHINFKPAIATYTGNSQILVSSDGNYSINNDVNFRSWNNGKVNFGHISLWRQKERLRVYLNGEKLWDLPKAFKPGATYNAVTFASQGSHNDVDYYVLGNIRLAVGSPDTRNKLVTEGKFVTTGILFDVNKDVIKPESYGTLKSIAGVLNENADIKVKIIGHTDSDGDDKSNVDLSKRRAEAVKASLSKDFNVDASRMQTDGKGESQPADKNESVTGKANNRRVEFIKL